MYILSFGSFNLPLRFISNFGEIWIKLIKSSSAIRNYSFCATVDKVKIPIKVVNTKTVLSNLIQEVVTYAKATSVRCAGFVQIYVIRDSNVLLCTVVFFIMIYNFSLKLFVVSALARFSLVLCCCFEIDNVRSIAVRCIRSDNALSLVVFFWAILVKKNNLIRYLTPQQ